MARGKFSIRRRSPAIPLGMVLFLPCTPACLAQKSVPADAQPTPRQVNNPAQPPGLDIPRPGRTAGEKPQPGEAGETPLDTPSAPAVPDTSILSSPVGNAPATAARKSTGGLRVGTAFQLRLATALSSGSLRNGDTVEATLARPVRLASGRTLATGTPARLTVVSAARAGVVQSGGVLSVEAVSLGGMAVTSNILARDGAEGHKDVADSAPAKGSEAVFDANTVLDFKVLR